jgi:hypothetical protein
LNAVLEEGRDHRPQFPVRRLQRSCPVATKLQERLLLIVRRQFPEVDPAGTFTLDDYMHACGRASDALLYVALFCPPLIELDGSVLLLRSVEDQADRNRFLEYKASKGRRAAETSFNFVEVPYLFGPQRRALSEDDDHIIAEAIAASWRAWLPAQYPGRSFVVELLEPEQTGSVVGIHFCEMEGAQ